MQTNDPTNQPGLLDDTVLDEWRIPFGDWYDQAVDWIDVQFNDPLKATEGFFKVFIDFVNEDILLGVPWLFVVIAFFLLGWLLQNFKTGVFAAVALTICGLMGATYWPQTARTIGYITVAVVLCCVIGIPIGIISGRMDSFWQAVRPLLDAAQVVHSFIYMLPFIYYFGIGPVSATIVTMVFAIPPVIRLTNLGIRQVPEDVVEASRAFGQTELQILKDVQLPLARPAIMTGINQTLLMAISMLGIAALMGAGGLARFMFQALNNQDPALSGSAGLSFFLVAVVLDRLTQRDGDSSRSLWYRMRRSWALRAKPEELLAEVDELADANTDDPFAIRYEPIAASERPFMGLAALGAVVTLVSLLLPWNSNGGWFTSFSRRLDELGEVGESGPRVFGNLAGESFNGLAGSGGSWFGFVLIAVAIFVLAAVVAMATRPGRTQRWLNPDGVAIAGVATLVLTVVYLLSSPSSIAVASRGIGPVIAVIGGAMMAGGALLWCFSARQEPLRPLPDKPMWAPVVTSIIALGLIFGGGFASWIHDERAETIISAEVQGQIDALTEEARDPDTPTNRIPAIANEIAAIRAAAEANELKILNGWESEGPQSSIPLLFAAALGALATAAAAGAFFIDTRRQWLAGTVALGLGAGIFLFALGYIGTLARATDPNVVSGIGSFFALCAGAALANAGRSVIHEFRRSRVYPEVASTVESGSTINIVDDAVDEGVPDLVGAAGN